MGNFCPLCGKELILEDNQMLSDIEGWEEGTYVESDDSMVTFAHCPHCNCEIEMYDANRDEHELASLIGTVKIYKPLEE